jgi:superfamily II DNA helicase RecQ
MTTLNQRQRREEDRLDKIVRYAYSTSCRRRVILSYFGQELDGLCAGCDICHKVDFDDEIDLSISPSLPKLAVGGKKHKQTASETAKGRATGRATGQISGARGGMVAGYSSDPGIGSAAQPEGNELAVTILELTGELKGKFGRTTIAQVLGGSKASKLKAQNLNKLNAYGSYAHMSNTDILATIDALVAQGKLRVVPGPYPKLVTSSL